MIQLYSGNKKIGPLSLVNVADALRQTMGVQSFHTYMNPQAKKARELYDVTIQHAHYSITHGASLGIYMLGISKKAELEFDVQRDVVHLSRETSARTKAQDEPTVFAMTEEGALVSKEILKSTINVLAEFKKNKECSPEDWREERNALYPLSGVVSLGLNATLRNFMKVLSDLNSSGKEKEYREILKRLNDSLHSLFPELFKPTKTYSNDSDKNQKQGAHPVLGLAGLFASAVASHADENKKISKKAISVIKTDEQRNDEHPSRTAR